MREKIEVSIIIVHYKVKKELFVCLSSIEESHTQVSHEVIIVDNDEKKTIEKELRKNFPHVIYIANTVNNGWGGGVNVGVKFARGTYLFLLNPDTVVKKGAIDTLDSFISKKRGVGVASSTLLDKNGNEYPLQGTGFLNPFVALFAFSFINKMFPQNIISRKFWLQDINRKIPYRVDVAPLSASLIERKLFKQVGGFDEGFFMYFEEYDLANKISKLGLKNYILPSSRVIHLWEASAKKTGKTEERIKESRKYYFAKYYGKPVSFFIELLLRMNKKQTLSLGITLIILLLVMILSF